MPRAARPSSPECASADTTASRPTTEDRAGFAFVCSCGQAVSLPSGPYAPLPVLHSLTIFAIYSSTTCFVSFRTQL